MTDVWGEKKKYLTQGKVLVYSFDFYLRVNWKYEIIIWKQYYKQIKFVYVSSEIYLVSQQDGSLLTA